MLRLLCLFLLSSGSVLAAANPIEEDIRALAAAGRLSEPDYWVEHATPTGQCDGARTAKMLTEVAAVIRQPAGLDQALDILVGGRVLGAKDYWTQNAVAGRACAGKNVAVVLSRCAQLLPLPVPPSASAVPLPAKSFENVRDRYDLVVAGAGMGGIGAAVQAARMGHSVLLLEETEWIGGQATAAGVTSMDEGRNIVRERGLYRELCGLVSAYYRARGINPYTAYWFGHLGFEPRVGRELLHRLLGEAATHGPIDLVYLAKVSRVERQGDTVRGVEVTNGGKTRRVACTVLVDATEWGDVIPLTGARYRVGNTTSDAPDLSRAVQDNTWTATIRRYPAGVPDSLRLRTAPPGYTPALAAAFAKSLVPGDRAVPGNRPWNWATFIGYRGMPDSARPGDAPPITRTHLNYNNDFHSTVAEIEDPARRRLTDRAMQRKTLGLVYFIQNTLGQSDWAVADDEGYDTPARRAEVDAWIAEEPALAPFRESLIRFSVMPYVRESRRIIGLHTLRPSEIERAPGKPVQFATTVALGDYAIDLHGSMRPDLVEPEFDRPEDFPKKFGERGLGPFAIPFECFIPEKIDGFLPAEKNLSQSRLANGATRLQPHTLLMGQAVGVIASLAVAQNIPPRRVDPAAVQKVLVEAGATLRIDPVPGVRWGTPEWRAAQFEALRAGRPAAK